jgi:hypothetical protein
MFWTKNCRSWFGKFVGVEECLELEKQIFVKSGYVFKTPFLQDFICFYCFRDEHRRILDEEASSVMLKLVRLPKVFGLRASVIAAASVFIARKNLSCVNLSWTWRLAQVTGLDFERITGVVGELERQLRGEEAKVSGRIDTASADGSQGFLAGTGGSNN